MTLETGTAIILLATYYFVGLYVDGFPSLLFANRKDIRLTDVSQPRTNTTVIINHLEDAAALDYHLERGLVFWTDISLEMIKATYVNGSMLEMNLITTGLISPDGLACDWLGGHLYWTDSETNRIELARIDGSNRKVLFWEDLDQPRAVVLSPMDGLMFWSDWGEIPKLERAAMDGDHQSRKIIVNKDIFWPNGLTVDYQTKKVYWADAKLSTISSMDYEGNNRHVVIQGNLPHPFAITLYEDTVYWTDWQTRSIHSCNKRNGGGRKVLFGGNLSPMDLRVYAPERQMQIETPCHKNNGGCSHLCLMSPKKEKYACTCPTGVKLLDDHHMCANGSQDILLLARRTDVRKISLDTEDYTDVVLPLDGVRHAIAIDYDPVEGYIYWTDDEVRSIRRTFLNGTKQEDLVTSEVDHPDGIAVDWVARNLYWTDTGTDRIEVARLNGSSRRVLIADHLEEPRAIVLDPSHGYMYWSDWGKVPKIERASMDGTLREVLANTSLGWPNGLSLDFGSSKIYWADAKMDKIEYANLDGSDRRTLISDPHTLPHVFGFSVLDDFVYWTDWQKRSIERIHKQTAGQRQVIVDQLPDLMGLKAVNVHRIMGTNECANTNNGCSHLCLKRPLNLGAICACPMGMELAIDSKTCIVPEAFLLFARRTDIRRISLEQTNNNDIVIPVTGVKEASALDFDINDNRIYWTDITLKTISRSFMNGSHLEHIVEFGLEYPEGMAVDWVARNLYWADMGSNRIEVCRLDGNNRRALIWKNIENPRSIALDPSQGFMYWSDWGSDPRIERAAMDGSRRSVLISKLGRANGLTIDYADRRIYWANLDLNTLESSDLSGADRHKVISETLPHPFGVTQYTDYIYWTDWNTRSIERANKVNGTNRTRIQGQLDYVMDILVFHASRQSGWNYCAINNGGCSRLCLALPFSGSSNVSPQGIVGRSGTHMCGCPTHFDLSEDGISCIEPHSFLLFAQKTIFNRLIPDLETHAPDMVLPIHGLKNIKSIQYDPITRFVYWVDGRTNSVKRANENGTNFGPAITNPGEIFNPFDMVIDPFSRVLFWTCTQTNIINITRLDMVPLGVIVKGNDERPRAIAIHPFKGLLFWVNMVSPARIERAALDGTERVTLFQNQLESPTSLAVDVIDDLIFWSDTSAHRIEMADINGANRRVLIDTDLSYPASVAVHGKHVYWVDKEQQSIERADKRTGSDRKRLLGKVMHLSDIISVYPITTHDLNSHPCAVKNGDCSHICMAVEQSAGVSRRCSCPLGLMLSEDEQTCREPPTCPPDHFTCETDPSECIPMVWKCDGIAECEDKSDETGCPACGPSQFTCRSGQCIDHKLRCDGLSQCNDDSDEHQCCHLTNDFQCHTGNMECVSVVALCDGKPDCLDGSDEEQINCNKEDNFIKPFENQSSKTSHIMGPVGGILALVVALTAVFYFCNKRKVIPGNQPPSPLTDIEHDESLEAQVPLNPQGHTLVQTTGCMGNGSVNGRIANGIVPNGILAKNGLIRNGGDSIKHSLPGSLYDRSHVTGASSSTTTSGSMFSTHYPHETLNPPPSPVTDDQSVITDYGSHQRQRHHNGGPFTNGASASNNYRHYRQHNKQPPPTPNYSTDANEDSCCYTDTDNCTESAFPLPKKPPYINKMAANGASVGRPPPPTPRSNYDSDFDTTNCNSDCYPPSPSTERSYFVGNPNPLPPPPSPVNQFAV